MVSDIQVMHIFLQNELYQDNLYIVIKILFHAYENKFEIGRAHV